ncbi:MAG: hypothetical protein Q9221_004888 [Calogaya cf. arnoldii]
MNRIARPAKKICKEPDKVDERLERIRENIWPTDPYLMDLVAPSSYHLPPHLANNWRRSCPFDKNEEQLQYMTFLPHTAGRADTMLRTTGDWDDGNGKLKNESAKRASGSSSSGAISPLPGQPPRKKISLLDYNRKKAGQAGGKASPEAIKPQSLTIGKPPQIAEATAKATVMVGKPLAPVKELESSEQPSKPEPSRGHKRSADEMANSQGPRTSEILQAATASTRARTEVGKPKVAAAAAAPAKVIGVPDLPRMLSPTLPARSVGVRDLPPMLSPTLPACVEERFAKLRGDAAQTVSYHVQKPGVSDSATNNKADMTMRNSSKAKIVTKDKHVEPQLSKTAAPTKESALASKSKVPDGDINTKSIPTQESTTAEKASTTNVIAGRTSSPPVSESKQSSKVLSSESKDLSNAKRRLLIVLRIPKSLRKNCQRILQLQPRPRKSLSGGQLSKPLALQERPQDQTLSKGHDGQQLTKPKAVKGDDSRKPNEHAPKPKVVANGLAAPQSGEPRRLTNPDKEPPSKRQRLSGIEDLSRPQTPAGSEIRSPGLPQHHSGHKSQLSTPKTDRKSTAMDRIKSSEGDVKTPLGSIRSNTPVITGGTEASNNREGRSSSNVSATSVAGPSKKDEEGSIYRTEFTRYAEIARTLKREADALTKSPDGFNPDTTIRRQGLAKAIETAICYMLAFIIMDEPLRIKKAPGDRAAWDSLLPYFNFLKTLTRDTESLHLQGFLHQLEAVCRDTIHQYDLERLERETVADEMSKLIKQAAENGRQARQAWIEGTKWLTHDDLRRSFPKTWEQRSQSPGDKTERFIPRRYNEGSYFLPLGNASINIEAVRFGWSFLEEWCKKEGVNWSGKIGL